MTRGYLLQYEDLMEIKRAVKLLQSLSHATLRPEMSPGLFSSRRTRASVPVVNNTSEDLEIYSVVRISRSTTKETRTHEESPTIENSTYRWEAEAPDSSLTGAYGVLQVPAYKGDVAEALLSGVTKVRIDDSEEGEFADPVSGDFSKMKSAGEGLFQILGVETAGSSDTFGYILMGGGGGATSALFPIRVIKTSGAEGSSTEAASWKYDIYDLRTYTNPTDSTALYEDMNPETLGWVRPEIGALDYATLGIARFWSPGSATIIYLNETLKPKACSDE